jgi:purine-binding chemotaxis protein CheW
MTIANEGRLPVLTFSLGGQRYGILIADVVEVTAMIELMPITDSQPEILGVANRHGTVLPMLDLRRVLEHDAQPITTSTLFIVVADDEHQVGLVVDEVHQVEYLAAASLSSPQRAGKYIRGIISYESELIQIVDPVSLLTYYMVGEADE